MKHSSKKLPNSVVEVEVILDHKEFLDYYQPVYDQVLASIQLKGFRPGAAPKEMAEKAVDKEKVFNEAVNKAVRDNLKEITEDNHWQLVDQPRVEVLETNPQDNLGLKYKVTLTVFPEIKLADYKKIAKKVFAEKKPVSVTDKEVNDSIQWVLNSRAKLTRVTREAKNGDLAEIDFSGKIDGKDLDGATGKSDSFVLGEGKFIKGFEENLAGHKAGENLEFPVTFPEDYWKEDLRNKKVDFKVDLKAVFERQLPELTDEFVKGLGKFETVAALKTSVKEGVTKEKTEKENERLRLKIIEEIARNSAIEPPEIMVNRTLENLVAEYKQYESLNPNPNKESKTEEEIRKNLEVKAKNNVATNLVLYEIAKKEKLEPTPEEVEAETNELVKNLPKNQAKDLDSQRIYDYSYGMVQNKKVFQFLENFK